MFSQRGEINAGIGEWPGLVGRMTVHRCTVHIHTRELARARYTPNAACLRLIVFMLVGMA